MLTCTTTCLKRLGGAALSLLLLLLVTEAQAALVLEWAANPEPDVVSYNLYVKVDGVETSRSVGNKTSYAFTDAVPGKTYRFTVSAVDAIGQESPRSNVIQTTVAPPSGDTDNDGIPDASDPDDDNDGLSDAEEQELGTNALKADTDDDGRSDADEVADGTDPLEPASRIFVPGTTVCVPWNNFHLMANIGEHQNFGLNTLAVAAQVLAIDGEPLEETAFSLEPSGQFDYLAHEAPQRHGIHDSYGMACSTHDGADGDLRVRLVNYMRNPGTVNGTKWMQFAYATTATNGTVGPQAVHVNNFQPSLDSADAANPVAVWNTIMNRSSREETGRLRFFGQDGSLLGTEDVRLPAGARRDFAGHEFGPNRVGVLLWEPDNLDPSARFDFGSVRYVFDNPWGVGSFVTAFQIPGAPGSGRKLMAPVDLRGKTAVIEIGNVRDIAVRVEVELRKLGGTVAHKESFVLPPYGSRHVIADPYLGGQTGVAFIEGSSQGSIVAVAMHYARRSGGGIVYMYGLPAVEPLGIELRGSYNTWLGQRMTLFAANASGEDEKLTVSLVRSDGTPVSLGTELTVPAKGLIVEQLQEDGDHYGTVIVQPASGRNSSLVWLTRETAEYVIPTQALQ